MKPRDAQCLGCLCRHQTGDLFCSRCERALLLLELGKLSWLVKGGVAAMLAVTLWWPR